MSNAGSAARRGVEADKKPAVASPPPSSSSHIILKVLGQQDGRVLSFRIKRSLKMRTLMQAYSDRLKVDANTFVFLYDGVKLSPDDTPDELKLEDGAEIDAMLHQDGGFFHCAFM